MDTVSRSNNNVFYAIVEVKISNPMYPYVIIQQPKPSDVSKGNKEIQSNNSSILISSKFQDKHTGTSKLFYFEGGGVK